MAKERVLLKISGETLLKVFDEPFEAQAKVGYNRKAINFIAKEIVSVKDFFELAIVIGGGNLVRGTQLKEEVLLQDGVVADYAGMLGTVVNAIVFQEILEKDFGLETRVQTGLEVRSVAEPYIRRKAVSHLRKGRVLIFAGGTGHPDFSTDTAMVLRAHEIGAVLVLKGTKVDGIYDKDPNSFYDARFLARISYMDYLSGHLKIVDETAVTLASKHALAIRVFNIFKEGNLRKILTGEKIGSEIS
ncbi:MAG: uridine monophosphate kinase [Candidatus Yanofskybacteria bacterium]|nr:uridine monophosphate kinase [Candidatus Yanofskybacteria bacterium]